MSKPTRDGVELLVDCESMLHALEHGVEVTPAKAAVLRAELEGYLAQIRDLKAYLASRAAARLEDRPAIATTPPARKAGAR